MSHTMTSPTEVSRLSRKLALHFEPEPTWSVEALTPQWLTSDGGYWMRWTGKEKPNTQPRSITDAEVFVRLLKWLLERGCNLDLEMNRLYFKNDGKTPLRRWVNMPTPSGVTIELAVALAVERVIDAS